MAKVKVKMEHLLAFSGALMIMMWLVKAVRIMLNDHSGNSGRMGHWAEEICETMCCYCGEKLEYKWIVDKGFPRQDGLLLIADWVVHEACFNKVVKEDYEKTCKNAT